MRFASLIASLLMATASLPALAADTIRIRVSDFAPLYFQQDGQWTGLDVELAQAIVREAGFEPKYMLLPWSRALAQLRTGEVDLMMNLTRTADREAFTHFIGPVRTSKRVLVVRRENLGLRISNLDELADAARRAQLPFGIQKDAKYSEEFDARLASDMPFAQNFDAVTQGMLLPRKVAQKHNLGFFEDVNYAVYHLKTDPDFRDLAIHPFLLEVTPAYFGLSKQVAAATLEKLQSAFMRLEASGTLARIRSKWDDVGAR